VVLTTHYLEEAEELCQRVAIMDESRIVALDTPAGLIATLDADARVSYTDASGRQRTQQNVYIPWSLTVTPISMSEYGSVQASSLLRLSKLNCSITTSDGQTIASQQNNDWQTSC